MAQSYHYAVRGEDGWTECLDPTATHYTTTPHLYASSTADKNGIGVTCCGGLEFDSRHGCGQSLTYDQAQAHCQNAQGLGLHLCTKAEIESGWGKGCWFHYVLNWVTDTCTST